MFLFVSVRMSRLLQRYESLDTAHQAMRLCATLFIRALRAPFHPCHPCTIHYSPFTILHRPLTMIPVIPASFHFISPPCADPRENCMMPKGKMPLNRGSICSSHPPSPFLSPVKTPGFLSKISCFPFTSNCLNRIEPRFEPQTAARLSPTFDHFFPFTIHYSLFTRACPALILRPPSTEY